MMLPNEVHLWCAYDEEITSSTLLSQYHDLLSQDEQEQQKRFYFEKNRHQYLVTRALVRTVLSSYMPKINPKKWQFEKNQYGKPKVVNPSLDFPVEFNISHSDKLVVIAVANGVDVGVDVEYILRDRKVMDVVDRCFSKQETDALKSLSGEEKYHRFYDLWTLKEAYVKARGMGLSIPLDKFSYRFVENNKISITFDTEHVKDKPERWQFWHLRPNNAHKISVALRKEDINKDYVIKVHTVTPLKQTKIVNYPVIMTG